MINQNKLIEVLDSGLDATVSRPFLKLANALGCTEAEIIEGIRNLKLEGKIKRFGLVVRNRSIGFVHNAMVTLDVPDDMVDALGEKISTYPFIRLCYQRKRVLPEWRYNLYFMVHGKNRDTVLEQIETIVNENNLNHIPKEVLFSRKCLKQKGASYH